MSLNNIHQGKRQAPPRLFIYGIEGVGKSTIAADAPSPIFIPTEDGLDEIDCHSFPLCQSFGEVLNALAVLATEEHEYKTVVIDSADWLERLIHDELCRQYSVNSIEKVDGGYGRGYTLALTAWRQVIDALRYLREKKGMVPILLAHSKVEKFQDPESAAIDRFSPRLHKAASALLCDWCDAILLATRELGSSKGEKGGQRILRCVGSPGYVAKNRYRLPDVIPLSWDALLSCLINPSTEVDHQHQPVGAATDGNP